MAVMRMPASPPEKKITDKEYRTAISGEYNLKEKGSQASAFLSTIINNYGLGMECPTPPKCKMLQKVSKRKEAREARIMEWHK